MTTSPRARFAVETLEGRDMMSATLAAPAAEPVGLRYELENVLISSYQISGSAAGHALYQDVFIPAGHSPAAHGSGGGAGKVQMQDFHFATASSPAAGGHRGEIEILSYSWGASSGLEGLTGLAAVEVGDPTDAPVKAGYDLKLNKKV